MSDLKQLSKSLQGNLPQLENKKVLIFGDVGLDEYVNGDVTRISPEAPVPVVEVNNTDKKLGLSANVAANVKALGGEPMLFSLVGDDDNAIQLRQLLKEFEISSDYLMTEPSRATTSKLRVMTGHHHVVRVDYETKQKISPSTLSNYQEKIKNGIETCDVVIIQDYAKGMITEESCQSLISTAHSLGKKVIVDPYRSTPLSFYKGASFMTPNRDEALELAKQIPNPEIWQNVDLIGPALSQAITSENMVITLGSEGVKIFENNNIHHLPTFARKVFDVTGAGDTVIAAFSLGVACNWDLKETAFLANMAAGVVVGQVGAVACSKEDLLNYLTGL